MAFYQFARRGFPKDQGKLGRTSRGFGAVKVRVKVGKTVWDTSVFPDSETGCYLLPVKKAVRKSEGLLAGDRATFQLEVLNPISGGNNEAGNLT
jgi:hypothetical protein